MSIIPSGTFKSLGKKMDETVCLFVCLCVCVCVCVCVCIAQCLVINFDSDFPDFIVFSISYSMICNKYLE